MDTLAPELTDHQRINLEPLRETFRRINADPASYNQMYWGRADRDPRWAPACKTALCIAGHLAIADGWEPLWEVGRIFDPNLRKHVDYYWFEFVEKDGEEDYVGTAAADILLAGGCETRRDTVVQMFAAENEPCEIQALAERLAHEAGEELGVVLLPEHPSHREAE